MIDDRMIRNWRTKYGLSLGTPAEAARWWETHNDGRAPPGAVEALGNSMAVPCMAWIGKRIAMVHEMIGGAQL